MKKIAFLVLLALCASESFGQVFNTGQTLRPGTFSAGFEPAVLVNGGSDFILYLHGGYGLKKGIDFSLSLGVLGPVNYFGGNVEFALARMASLAVGAHHYGNFGLDGTLVFTFPIRKDIRIFTGADLDINFYDGGTSLPLWIPIGLEVGLKSHMSFIFEASIGLTNPAYHLIGGGLNFYF